MSSLRHPPDDAAPSADDLAEDLTVRCLAAAEAGQEDLVGEILAAQPPELRAHVQRLLGLLTRVGLDGGDAAEPERLGPFQLVERVGAGTMGVVYRARREGQPGELAVKLLQPGLLPLRGARLRFRREIAALRELDHPGICPIVADGEVEGVPFLAMPFVRGESLRARFAREPAPAGEARAALLGIVRQLALALHHAHERGFVHRDVKPANVIVRPDGQVVLLDFGLARFDHGSGQESQLTRSGGLVGTPAYMAPEQVASGAVDHRCDVYAVGALLYEGLTGRLPHAAPTRELLYRRILGGEVLPPSRHVAGLLRDLDVVCLTALERDPARRYGSAMALAQDLERVLAGRPPQARLPGPFLRARRWVARNPLPAGLLAVLAAATLGILVLAGWLAEERQISSALARAARARAIANGVRSARDADTALADSLAAYDDHPGTATASAVQAVLAAERPTFELSGHTGQVVVLGFAADCSRVLSASVDGTARVWDLADGGDPLELRHGSAVASAVFASDGATIATAGSADGKLCVWDAGSGRLRKAWHAHGPGQPIVALAWSPDGQWLFSGSADGSARMWSSNGDLLAGLPPGDASITVGQWLDSGTLLVGTAAAGGTERARELGMHARCWRFDPAAPPEARLICVRQLQSAGVKAFALHPSRRDLVLVIACEKAARLWSLDRDEPILLTGGVNHDLVAGAFLAGGERLFTAARGNRITVFDLEGTSRSVPDRGIAELDTGIAHPTMPWFAVAGDLGLAQILNEYGVVLRSRGGGRLRGTPLAFAPDGSRLAAVTMDDRVLIFDMFARSRPMFLAGQQVWDVCWLDDRTCLTGGFSGGADGRAIGRVEAWDAPTGSGVRICQADRKVVGLQCDRRNGRLVVLRAGQSSAIAEVWHRQGTAWVCEGAIDTKENLICHTARFVNGGGQVLLCESHGGIGCWDVQARKLVHRVVAADVMGSGQWQALAATEDGGVVWAGGTQGLLHRFDRQADGSYREATPARMPGQIRALEVLPDGSLLVGGSGGLLRRIRRDGAVTPFECSLETFTALAWTEIDGTLLIATPSELGGISLWSADGKLLRELPGHTGQVSSVAFSPDGSRLLSGSFDGTARIWFTREADMIAAARAESRAARVAR